MQIRYKNTYLDLLAFNVMHQFHNPVMQALMVLVTGLVFAQTEGHQTSVKIVSGVMGYAALWAFQIAFTAVYLISRNNHAFLTEHLIELQEDALYEETAFNKSYFYWNKGVVKIVKRGPYLAVYMTANMAHIIPRKAFSSKEQQAAFYKSVTERIVA